MSPDKGGGRSLPVDPSLPRWVCQNCRHPLSVVGVDSYADKFFGDPSRSGMQASSMHGAGSILGSCRMDNSFVMLPKQRSPGFPPRPRSSSQQPGNLAVSGSMNPPGQYVMPERLSTTQGATSTTDSHSNKAMEESFVVLPPAAASVYKVESSPECGIPLTPPPGGGLASPSNMSNAGFNSSITVLKRAFDIATAQTQVEEEERRLEAAIEEIERQCAEVNADLQEVELKSKRFEELEKRYWHEFNDFQFQLTMHQEERDAILAKIEVSQAHLELLKRTNVLNDAFPIYHDGDFGTINNYRLGRLPKIPVEWDETNAAWGQACLLLHTMAQYCRPKFLYRIKIIPMGSYPRITDSNNNTFDLFGPVNIFWSSRYDTAMTLFLACLKDFAEFANSMDKESGIPLEDCFKLPYKIENDKVENYSIIMSFNKPENWTKALKYTLCNLKWVLFWFVGNTGFQPHRDPSVNFLSTPKLVPD
ncbi:beclin-1-like protein isoform X2 [Amborella trichopoda]|uniref:beclin-1-like protein isoform X2 n=1 Tax=Amborella trichopoda TaxID=13333 RepID=UPI0005D3D946|nr:beclin-1-like protein isoform X2 [Amborella trichopoda]|eukprot:XP_011624596.1 beclin-1-like protein isoform X2 [Amborella trichopoda]